MGSSQVLHKPAHWLTLQHAAHRNRGTLTRTLVLLTTQVVVSGVPLFRLYKFIYRTFGPGNLGFWSRMLATMGITKFRDLDLSGSLGRFVQTRLFEFLVRVKLPVNERTWRERRHS